MTDTTPQLDGQAELLPDDDKPPKAPAKKAAATKATGATKKAASSSSSSRRRKVSTSKGGRPGKDQFRQVCSDTVDQVLGLLTIGSLTSPRLAYDVQVLQLHADELTDELFRRGWDAKSGRLNRFGQWLVNAGQLGEWGRTFTLIAGIGLPIAANHGLVPTETVMLVNLARREPLPVPEPRPAKDEPLEDEPGIGHGGWPVVVADDAAAG